MTKQDNLHCCLFYAIKACSCVLFSWLHLGLFTEGRKCIFNDWLTPVGHTGQGYCRYPQQQLLHVTLFLKWVQQLLLEDVNHNNSKLTITLKPENVTSIPALLFLIYSSYYFSSTLKFISWIYYCIWGKEIKPSI